MIDCRDCEYRCIVIDEEDLESYWHCDNDDRHICNLHENVTAKPEWCKYRLNNINEQI